MYPIISLTDKEQQLDNLVILLSRLSNLPAGLFSRSEKVYIGEQVEKHKKELIRFNRIDYRICVFVVKEEKENAKRWEACRKAGDITGKWLNEHKAKRVAVFDTEGLTDETLAFAEGMALGCYQFLKYKNDKKDQNTLEKIEIYSKVLEEPECQDPASGIQHPASGIRHPASGIQDPASSIQHPASSIQHPASSIQHPASSIQHPTSSIQHLNILTDAVFRCRDLINEPNSFLTATVFAREVKKMAESCGIPVEILNKKKLEALKMGGILGVNQGSIEPPTFTVIEWKPEHSQNNKPFVFIGKGVVYDSGGMNLKPGDTMMNMKDDMSGAAAVAASIYAIAKANLPVHVVGLLPATDNRPGEKALVSGDIIRMHNGMTVEVQNTDAEGRLLLADALSYAQKYHPGLVIDLATLTGAAVRAIGKFGAAAMQSKAAGEMEILKICGEDVYERLVEFPLWEEYAELVKSDLADLKNVGPPEAGMITAGKFLEKFTGYPYIHLDIAGPAFLDKQDSYRGLGGTGFGVRLLFDFMVKFAKKRV